MSESKDEEQGSLPQVNKMAESLFGGGTETNDDDVPKKENNDNSNENTGEDDTTKKDDDEHNSDKEKDSTDKSDATKEDENLEQQANDISGALINDKKEENESQNEKSETEGEKTEGETEGEKTEGETEGEKTEGETEGEKTEGDTEGEKTEGETEGEKEKSETDAEKTEGETEGEKEKSGTDAEKTEGETDGTKDDADSSALGNTLGDLTGTLTGENENKNDTETDNNNDDTNDEKPVHEPSTKKSSTTPRRTSPRYNDTQPVSTQNYSDEELKKAVDDLLKNNKAPEDDMVPALRKYIESEMTEAAMNQKYEYGVQLEKATNILNQVTATDPVAIKSETKRREAEERHATAKEKYDSSVKEWDDRISQYRQEQEKRISELEQEHKRQMADFEEQWSKPENMLEYNKPSPQLIRLRTTEQNLALQKNFERAKEVKLQADRLMKEEQAEAQKRAVADMRLNYEALDMRQKREMECLLQHTQSTIDLMERERDKCIVPMSQIVKRHKENSRPKTSRGGTRGLSDTARTSPRPIRTKITATTIKPAIGLGITGIDVKQYIKPKKQLSQTLSKTQSSSPRK